MTRLKAPILVLLSTWLGGLGMTWAIPVAPRKSAFRGSDQDCVRSRRGRRWKNSQSPCQRTRSIRRSKRSLSKIDLRFRAFPRLWQQPLRQRRESWVARGTKRKAKRRVAKVPPGSKRAKHPTLKVRKRLRKTAQAQPKTDMTIPGKLPPRFDNGYATTNLESVYKQVKRNNLDLRILREQVIRSEIARANAWSILKPQLSLQGSYTRNEVEAAFNNPLTGDDIVITPQNQLAFQLQLQWAFLNFQSIPVLQIAYMSVEQVGHTAKQVRREILFAAARAYYGILLADGLVDITRRSWEASREHLRISIARYNAGVAPELVVTRAQLDLAVARQSWIQAQNGLRNARLAMALLLNRKTFPFRPQRPAPPQLPAGGLNAWMHQARMKRPELQASRIAVRVASKQITSVWMKFLPTVAVLGKFSGINAAGFAGQNTQWSVTLAATLNIYSGGTRYMELKDAHSKYRQARLELAKSLLSIGNEIRQGNISLLNAKVALQVSRKQLGLARRSYQLTQERYKTGVATPVEVTDALTALRSAEIRVLQETLNREVAILTLRRAIGMFRKKQ